MLFSIILPIKNEAEYIDQTLYSLKKQNLPIDSYEIIISDGGSTDGTLKIIDQYTDSLNMIILNNKKSIVSSGFNLGLNIALGEFIIRIDGHCVIPSDFIKRCRQIFKNKNVDIVGGIIETSAKNTIGKSISIAQSSLFGIGNSEFRNSRLNNSRYVDTLAFGMHKREIFSELGGYDEEMVCNQDDEFNFRAIQNGKKIWLDPSIKTIYYSRTNYIQLFKQYFNYGFFKVRGIQKRKQIFSIRHLVPSVFVILSIGTLLFGFCLNFQWLSFSILFPYLVLNLFSSILYSQKNIQIFFIFISFWILHSGYGLGFIWGLIRLLGKWKDDALKDNHFIKEQFIANNR